VLSAAKKLGYAPDPHMARLMARIRSYRRRRAAAVIALVRDDIPGDELLDHAYQYVALDDIRTRAARHGYRAEEFRLDRTRMSAPGSRRSLTTRGIEGLIISPQSSHSIGSEIDYSRFAAVTLGYGLTQPALHRASTHMTAAFSRRPAELAARGYRRIGLGDHAVGGQPLRPRLPGRHADIPAADSAARPRAAAALFRRTTWRTSTKSSGRGSCGTVRTSSFRSIPTCRSG
jgi:DNA-binding LacI/PurR family transcriptional regulator